MRFFLKYWAPVVGWMLVIFLASGDLMSAEHTSRFIGPFLRWIVPDISPVTIVSIQLVVRKCAHLTEYAILAALLWRALRQHHAISWRAPAIAFVITAVYASLDEFHQFHVASRTGSSLDVLIDCAGALLGIAIYRWFWRHAAHRNENSFIQQ